MFAEKRQVERDGEGEVKVYDGTFVAAAAGEVESSFFIVSRVSAEGFGRVSVHPLCSDTVMSVWPRAQWCQGELEPKVGEEKPAGRAPARWSWQVLQSCGRRICQTPRSCHVQ